MSKHIFLFSIFFYIGSDLACTNWVKPASSLAQTSDQTKQQACMTAHACYRNKGIVKVKFTATVACEL